MTGRSKMKAFTVNEVVTTEREVRGRGEMLASYRSLLIRDHVSLLRHYINME
jgi:hypothetical protein